MREFTQLNGLASCLKGTSTCLLLDFLNNHFLFLAVMWNYRLSLYGKPFTLSHTSPFIKKKFKYAELVKCAL